MNSTDQWLEQGVQHHQAGRLAEAEAVYRQVLAQNPNQPRALQLLGLIALEMNQYQTAAELICRAIALDSSRADFHSSLGRALAGLGQIDAALQAYRTALRIQPDLYDAYHGVGLLMERMRDRAQAIANYRLAIQIDPNRVSAYNNLGNILQMDGKLDEAAGNYRRALQADPNSTETLNNLANLLKSQGDLDESIRLLRQAIAKKPDFVAAHSNLVYTLHFHPDCDAKMLSREHRLWYERHAAPLKKLIQPLKNDRNPDRRLRIGYVSPDFREHSVGRFISPLLAHHNHGAFEIFCYSDVITSDSITQRIRSAADVWRPINGMNDLAVAELIRTDQIDILVDLTMHMNRNRLLVFAQKPAPAQISYLAYCSTTGLETIDYRITDPFLEPPGKENPFVERPIHLPCYWCYEPPADAPQVNELPAKRKGHVTFGSFNNFCKVTEPTAKTWIQVLHAVPNSRLILHAQPGSHRAAMLDRFQRDGIDPNRITFIGYQSLAQYLKLHHEIDIVLDPFPYAGGTTSCDALWMGVPVISLMGTLPVHRAGLSILSTIGLPQFAARSIEQYTTLATELATDLSRLAELRSGLRDRMKISPLMDSAGFAQSMERAYREIMT